MVIIFNGPPSSGKDVACDILESIGYTHHSFKDTLYQETANLFCVKYEWFMEGYNDRNRKEKPEKELNNLSRREAMIFAAEKIIKPKYGNSYFGNRVASQINKSDNVCISDCGFIDELLPVIEKVGKENILLVKLIREGYTFDNDSRNYIETDLVHTSVIYNSTNLEHFKKSIIDLHIGLNT